MVENKADTLRSFVMQHGALKVECRTSGRHPRGYRVTFSDKDDGGPAVVECIYRRWNDTGRVYRTIWMSGSGKPMSIAAKCAIRAAIATAQARIAANNQVERQP